MPDPVDEVSLTGGPSWTVGGVQIFGVTSSDRKGGIRAPQYSTEQGYEYDTRINAKAVEVTLDGWVNAPEVSSLAALEQRREPISATGPNFSLPTCAVVDWNDEMPANYPGAHKISVEIREVQQASTGTTTLRQTTPDRTAEPGPDDGGGGDGGNTGSFIQTDGG